MGIARFWKWPSKRKIKFSLVNFYFYKCFPEPTTDKMTLKLPKLPNFISFPVVLVLLLLIFFSSCSGSRRTFRSVENHLESSPTFEKGFTGVMIYDPQKKKVIYEYNSHKYFTPASNTKLLTFYTGLQILGDSVPALEYTLQNDSLIFRGTGDPSLLNPYLPSSGVLAFLKNIKADLYYLPPKTEETFFGPGWAWDDYNDYYSVERSALPVYGNETSFKTYKFQELPEVYPSIFKDSLVPDSLLQKKIRRDLSKNLFYYPAEFDLPDLEQTIPFKTSSETAIALLSDTINRPIRILKPNPSFNLDRTLFSIPTDSLYKRMLQESDNFIAEQILMLAAHEISDTLKVANAIRHMKKNYLQDLPDEVKWVDGSGLSRYNLTTPANMVSLLEKIQHEVSYERLFHLLPAGGKSGTLKNQYKSEEPFIFAKTGSLSNNHSLSGFLKTKKGKILIFSFMNSNYVVPSAVLKQEMENILRAIRNNN